ncbi:EamA family transporter [Flaviflagellibacter deserti]|uniref:EamA family transporter n=1 Tax=Flaviflagellibacter deserti TaxID=2267266 RepID=A0ABV9YXX0_9HYPH
MTSRSLPLTHALLAIATVAIWGTNFPIMKVATEQMPPLLIAALRFLFVLFPAIFVFKRPKVPWRLMAAYGLLIGVGQFGLIYIAVSGYISPGLASLVIQTQVFFTIILAILITRERVQPYQWAGLALATIGVVVIGLHTGGDTTIAGLVMVLVAALSWAGGNIASKASGRVNMIAYVVWTSIFSMPILFVLAFVFEGWDLISTSIVTADAATWGAVLWQSFGNTLFGYACWSWLLSRHPAATVVPMALLVPVFGMGASTIWLGESLPAWKLAAGALVMSGLAISMLWPRLRPQQAGAAS